ncbi:sugar phosphate isomerase/epimerase family protein [Paenibacillus swuensis]|uniref:sugar phosphate isomerase/epimerase family protein n=1 Tax=Paenibacillus swuensis TaxID=1178515 RepID=UPI0008396B9A|nr:sugar phosphate isomerase/epimerase [Paenibacillus swuensis]
MSNTKVAIQARLWGLTQVAENFAAVFDQAALAGYAGVEVRYTILLEQEQQLKRYLQRNPDFSLAALHANLLAFEKQEGKERLKRLLEGMNELEIPYLIVSMGYEPQQQPWFELAAQVRELCGEEGTTLCYHNHAAEFTGGTASFFDTLTKSYHVPLAVDLAWVHRAGVDVIDFIDRYSEDIRYVHVKDTLGEQWKELGEGEMNLEPLLHRLADLRLPWWTVEQDFTDRDPFLSASMSRNYLKQQLNV